MKRRLPPPDITVLPEVVRKEGTVRGVVDKVTRFACGKVEILQKGSKYSLLLRDLNLWPEIKEGVNVCMYLWKGKAKARIPQVETRGNKLELEEGIDGSLSPKNQTLPLPKRIRLPLSHLVNPLEWDALVFAKPATAWPRSVEPMIYGYCNLSMAKLKWKENESIKSLIEAKRNRLLQLQEALSKQQGDKKAIRNINVNAKEAFIALGKTTRDRICFSEFRRAMQFLGVHMTHSRAWRLFRVGDKDGRGFIDFIEFSIAIRISNLLDVCAHFSPLDAFDLFDTDHRGFIDSLQLYEVIGALGIDISEAKCFELFQRYSQLETDTLHPFHEKGKTILVDDTEARKLGVGQPKPARVQAIRHEMTKRVEDGGGFKSLFSKTIPVGERPSEHESKASSAQPRPGKRLDPILKPAPSGPGTSRKDRKQKAREERRRKQAEAGALLEQLAKEGASGAVGGPVKLSLLDPPSMEEQEKKKKKRKRKKHSKNTIVPEEVVSEADSAVENPVAAAGKDNYFVELASKMRNEVRSASVAESPSPVKEKKSKKEEPAPWVWSPAPKLSKKVRKSLPLDLKISYGQFRALFLEVCNVRKELRRRGLEASLGWNADVVNRTTYGRALMEEEKSAARKFWAATRRVLLKQRKKRLLRQDERREKLKLRTQAERRSRRMQAQVALSERTRLAKEQAEEEELQKREAELQARLDSEQSERDRVKNEERREKLRELFEEQDKMAEESGKNRLIMSHSKLREVPRSIYENREAQEGLSNVVIMDFSYNSLLRLPETTFLFWLSGLRKLNLAHNNLTALPSEVECLGVLQLCDLSYNEFKKLPAEIQSWKSLEMLNVAGNKLGCLPDEIGGLPNLKRLVLFDNSIEFLPSTIHSLASLEVLDVRHNRLLELPEELSHLTTLKVLDISQNLLQKLPEMTGGMESLERLDFSSNSIQSLPPSISALRKLVIIRGIKNRLVELKSDVGGMDCLLEMDLSENRILAIPEEIGHLSRLQKLDLHDNRLTRVPTSIGYMRYLQIASFRKNNLGGIPSEIGALQSLRDFDISWNNICGSLPPAIGALYSLTSIDASHNKITTIPSNFGGMVQLVKCNLSNNLIAKLPDGFGELASLEELNLSTNKLRFISEKLGKLVTLVTLNLSANQLPLLPSGLAQLTNLTSLDLFNNRLEALPVEMGKMIPKLETFNVSKNPLSKLPQKWCDDWGPKERCTVMWTSGYTDAQIAEWAEDQAVVYRPCQQEWEANGHMHFGGKRGLYEFVEAVARRVGGGWRSRFERTAELFYHESMREGFPPRYDCLDDDELQRRAEQTALRSEVAAARVREAQLQQAENEKRRGLLYQRGDTAAIEERIERNRGRIAGADAVKRSQESRRLRELALSEGERLGRLAEERKAYNERVFKAEVRELAKVTGLAVLGGKNRHVTDFEASKIDLNDESLFTSF